MKYTSKSFDPSFDQTSRQSPRHGAWRLVLSLLVLVFLVSAGQAVAQDSAPFAQWSELQKGNAPDTVHAIENIDSVNLFNGNLSLRIPLGQSYPVNGGLSYGLTLVYNSNPWEVKASSRLECRKNDEPGAQNPFYAKTLDRLSNAGPGWMLNLGRFAPVEDLLPDATRPAFTYVSGDGSFHGLHPELHWDDETTYPGVYHTRDGSFIRMLVNATCQSPGSSPCRKLELPDGSHQEFRDVGGPYENFRPTLIADAFGNQVAIEYGAFTWILTDDHGRRQEVHFDTTTEAFAYSKIMQVILTAFDGQSATYDFVYHDPATIDRHQFELTVIEDFQTCDQILGNTSLGPEIPGVELLKELQLPDGSFYRMDYHREEVNTSGVGGTLIDGAMAGALQQIRLSTGLHYRFEYTDEYGIPNIERRTPAAHERVFGVAKKQRFIFDEEGLEQEVVTWEYDTKRAEFEADGEEPGIQRFQPCFRSTDLKFFAGDPDQSPGLTPTRHSRHYFSLAELGPDQGPHFRARRALPFTPCLPDGGGVYYNDPPDPAEPHGLYLSEEVFDPANPGGGALRSVWVAYETDAPSGVDDKDGNKRLVRRQTVYHDDGDRWIESRYEDFDGLGNYRKQVQLSSFEGSQGIQKTTYTSFNMEEDGTGKTGPDFTPAPGDRWLLGLYVEQCRHEGGSIAGCSDTVQQRIFYDFDPDTGFLHHMRRLRGSTPSSRDVLTVYKDLVGEGNVTSERVLGGDPEYDGEPGVNPNIRFGLGSAAVDHWADHTYDNGVRSRTVLTDDGDYFLETLDQGIDPDTGLVAWSRDTEGLTTYLDYDQMHRLTRIWVRRNGNPVNVATQLFRYTVPAEGSENLTFPQIFLTCEGGSGSCPRTPLGFVFEARTCPPTASTYDGCTSTRESERRYFYDRQGRLVDERRLIPWGESDREVWRKVDYDLADRMAWEAEWHASGQGFDVFFTQYLNHDVFDRPRIVQRPDGKQTTFVYTGDRQVARTVGVWTGSGEQGSTTTEQTDGFGRLIRVTEPSGSSGGAVHTTYRYDEGDRLTQVCVGDNDTGSAQCGGQGQLRTFDYDGSGFLISESHPEIEGAITYTYDGVGNRLKQDFGGADTVHDMSYSYDPASRVVQVLDGDGEPFVDYFYSRGTGNGTGPDEGRLEGRLYQARRHNRVPAGPGSMGSVNHVVTETYDYSAPGDRLSRYSVRSSQGASFTTEYAYDWQGNVTTLGYPECDRVPCADLAPSLDLGLEYRVDQLRSVPGWVNSLTYRATGEVSRIHHANNVSDQIQRNFEIWKPIDQIRIVHNPSTPLWESGVYEYDGAGNIYAIGQESFSYDLVSRLKASTVVTATGTDQESQSYDVFGNILSIARSGDATRHLSPDPATNRLSSSLAGYDLAGNMTSWTESSQTFNYEYAPDNRITVLEGNGKERFFLYTASGERFAILDQGTGEQAYMSRDPGNGLLSRFERDSSGTWSRAKDYIRAGSKVVATLADGTVRHLHHDHLGTTRLITDANGAVVGDLTTHYPFGTFAFDGSPDVEEHRFTGHERDDVGLASANLDYMHARYYTSSMGRFLSVDPVLGDAASPQTWNRYAYVYNNPVGNTDPDGRIVFGIAKKAVKLALKGGDVAATFAGAIDDFNTLRDPNAGTGERVIAAISLVSEAVSPLSVRDAKTVAAAIDSGGGIAKSVANGVAGAPKRIPWTSWRNYEKVTVDGQEYAQVGDRLFSRHAVDRMQPSGLRGTTSGSGGMPQIRQTGGGYDYGRGVAPQYIEDAIASSRGVVQENGNISHTSGSVQVILNPKGAVVTVITH